MSIEDRVGAIERETARHGAQIAQLSTDVKEIGSGVKTLLQQEARRPEPINLKVAAGVCSALAAIAIVGWWLVEHSPSIQDIKLRLTRLDDDRMGRVTAIERRLDNPASWSTTVRSR